MNQLRRYLLFLTMMSLFLGGCSQPEATPTASAVVPTTPATATHPAVPSPAPTFTPSPTPSNTPRPTQTTTHTPTQTASPTITPTATPAVWVAAGTPVPGSGAVISVDNATQVTQLAQWGQGVIQNIEVSADGQWLAVQSTGGLFIYQTADLTQPPLAWPNVGVFALAPAGNQIALAIGGEIQLWQLNPLQQLEHPPLEQQGISELRFSPTGRVLAVKRESNLLLLDVETGAVLASYTTGYLDFTFSPSGARIAIWQEYGETVKLYDWATNTLIDEIWAIFHHTGEGDFQSLLRDVQFINEDEMYFLVAQGQGSAYVTQAIEIQKSTENKTIISSNTYGKLNEATKYVCNEPIFYWDPPPAPEPYDLQVNQEAQIAAVYIEAYGFSDDFGHYSRVKFYDLATQTSLYDVVEGVVDLALLPDGQRWVAGYQDGRVEIRQLRDGAVLDSLDAFDSPLLDLELAPDNQWVAATFVDEIKVYQQQTGQLAYRYPAATSLAFTPQQPTFVVGYPNGQLQLRHTSDGRLISSTQGHQERVTDLAFLPNGQLLSAGFDCQLLLWHLPELVQVGSLENFFVEGMRTGEPVPMRIKQFLIPAAGEEIFGQLLGGQGAFVVWSATTQSLLWTPELKNPGYIQAIAPTGQTLAGYVPEVWNSSIQIMRDQERTDAAAFSPDSSLLVQRAGMKVVDQNNIESWQVYLQFWSVSSNTILTAHQTSFEQMTSLKFSADGHYIFSGALDGLVRVWGIP